MMLNTKQLNPQRVLPLTILLIVPFLLFACDLFNPQPPKNDSTGYSGFTFYNTPDPFTTETVFTVDGFGIQGISVVVMSLNRQELFEKQASGKKLSWDGKDIDGNPLPNGDYLYHIEALERDRTSSSDTLTLHIRGR